MLANVIRGIPTTTGEHAVIIWLESCAFCAAGTENWRGQEGEEHYIRSLRECGHPEWAMLLEAITAAENSMPVQVNSSQPTTATATPTAAAVSALSPVAMSYGAIEPFLEDLMDGCDAALQMHLWLMV